MATHSSILANNPMDRRPWQATVHGVSKTQMLLNTEVHTHTIWDSIPCKGTYFVLNGATFGEGNGNPLQYSFFFFFFLIYNILLVLPNINMQPPWVYTCSYPETPSHRPPHTIPMGHPSAPAPSLLYPALNLD